MWDFSLSVNGDNYSGSSNGAISSSNSNAPRVYNACLPVGRIWEENGSRSETFAQFEFTANVSYHCRWDDRFALADWLSHTVYNNPAESSDYSNANPSTVYYNSYYPAQVMSIQVNTLGAEGKTAYSRQDPLSQGWLIDLPLQPYTLAKLQVTYKGRARPSPVALKQTVTPSTGMRQLPSWGFYWRSDGSPVVDAESPAIQENGLKLSRTLSGVRRVPQWFLGLTGCINANAWTDHITGMNFLPGMLCSKRDTNGLVRSNVRVFSFTELQNNPVNGFVANTTR